MPLPYLLLIVFLGGVLGAAALDGVEQHLAKWRGPDFFAHSKDEVSAVKHTGFGWVCGFWQGAGRNIANQRMSRGEVVWRPTRRWAERAATRAMGE
jgi:hypothetical protein